MADQSEWEIPILEKPEFCETCRERPATVERGRGGLPDRTIWFCEICDGHAMLVRTLRVNGPSIWSAIAQAERDGYSDVIDNKLAELEELLWATFKDEDDAKARYSEVVKSVHAAFLAIRSEVQGESIMAQQKQPIDVGEEIAQLLMQWRPQIDGEDVASAIMYALEHYSVELDGASESGLESCLFKLNEKVEQRIKGL